ATGYPGRRRFRKSSSAATTATFTRTAFRASSTPIPTGSRACRTGPGWLHPRGNFEGFVRAASEQNWLEVHGIEHRTHFYTNYGVELQKKFFGHFLKG